MTVLRPITSTFGNASLTLPIYFPSISSVKTNLPVSEYIDFLSAVAYCNRQFLVSAFDLYHLQDKEAEKVKLRLEQAMTNGVSVLMDSGNYESYWKNQKRNWLQSHFHETLNNFPSSFTFSYDEQSPPESLSDHIRLLVQNWHKDVSAAVDRPVFPIIHGKSSTLTALCSQFVEATGASMVAVPERSLGDGIAARIRTVKSIRAAMNQTGNHHSLHLLGTGNPLSIALFSFAGADSFDGLEWCQTVVDFDTASLFHTTQADFFSDQTEWGTSQLSFQPRMLAHNLEFYGRWQKSIQDAISQGEEAAFVRRNFSQRILNFCVELFGWG